MANAGNSDRKAPLLAAPRFTGSLDATVAAENVVLTHYLAETGRWLAVSEASDGRVFYGTGNTEPLARRAAGLRTLAHLEARAEGAVDGQGAGDLGAARAELAEQLGKLSRMVAGYNGSFPDGLGREVVLVQIRAARDIAKASEQRGLVARYGLPVLLFLAGAFAEGVIGAYAEKCLETLTALLVD